VRPLGGTILLGPPLIFTRSQAERTVDVLDRALTTVEANVLLDASAGDAARAASAAAAR
jgi:hypothetical protein